MAWSAPATFNVGDILTAAQLNVNVRDNLNYLKGNAGAVAIANSMTVAGTLVATAGAANTDVLAALSGNSANYAGFAVGRTASEARFAVPASAGQFATGAAAGDFIVRVDDTSKKVLIGSGGTETVTIDNQASSVPFKARVTAGGMEVLCGTATGTLATLAPAGTVSTFMSCYISDYNAGTATVVHTFVDLKVSGSITYANTDTITVAVTAGGAITFQRTAGSNNHNVVVLCLFF